MIYSSVVLWYDTMQERGIKAKPKYSKGFISNLSDHPKSDILWITWYHGIMVSYQA